MKVIIFVSLILFTSACSCPECVTYPEQLRLVFMDSNGNNLLSDSTLQVSSVEFCNNSSLEFDVKDFVVKDSKEIMHLELLSEDLYEKSINSESCFTINFRNGDIDTVLYEIQRIDGKCCDSYKDSKLMYDNIDYLGKTENTIGAYLISK